MARQKTLNTKQQLEKDMLVPVANFTNGILIYVNKRNGMEWKWEGFGAVDEIELSELITIKSSQPKFLYEPWMFILDSDVVDHLGLTKMYENLMKPDDIDKIFQLSNDKIEELLQNAPSGMKQVIALRARDLMKQGKFDSLSKKRIIERVLNIKFDAE
jgi:hypothetical protein